MPAILSSAPSLFTALNATTAWLPTTLQANSTPFHTQTQHAIDIYLASIDPSTGLDPGVSYWQNANAYTAIALHDLWGGFTTNNATLHRNLITVMNGPGHSARSLSTPNLHNSSPPPPHPHKRDTNALLTRGTDFLNAYNDDSAWWALAGLAHLPPSSPTSDAPLLTAARHVYSRVAAYQLPPPSTVHGTNMSGGVLWTSYASEINVNAITTGLFAELGARLALLENAKDDESRGRKDMYLSAAQRAVGWIVRNRMLKDDRGQWVVGDTIDLVSGERKDWCFTYNTGQAIAAGVGVYEALKEAGDAESVLDLPEPENTGKKSPRRWFGKRRRSAAARKEDDDDGPWGHGKEQYLRLAVQLALPAMTRAPLWTDMDGTLTERSAYPGTHNKTAVDNSDAVGFKSVLLRSLAKLYRVLREVGLEKEVQGKIRAFVLWQWVSSMQRDRDWGREEGGGGGGELGRQGWVEGQEVKMQFGPWWAGPWDVPTSHSQMAALDVMAGLWGVVEKGPV